METVVVNSVCPSCHGESAVEVPLEDYGRWLSGLFVQDAFPYLSPASRERLLSGLCEECWQDAFAEVEA